MSTNFYAVTVPSLKEHQEMEKLLKAKMYERLLDTITNSMKRYHIGKRSGGWQFLFCANDEKLAPWEASKESLNVFISQSNIRIEDDCGIPYTPEEFWKEIGPWLYHDPKNYINGEDADLKYPIVCKLSEMEYTTSDGLRWSKDADFS